MSKKSIIWLSVLGVLLFFGFCIIIFVGSYSYYEKHKNDKPVPVKVEVKRSDEEVANTASDVVKQSFGVQYQSEAPGIFGYISTYKYSSGDLEVNLQTNATKEEVKFVSRQVMSLIGDELPEVDNVTVTSANNEVDFTFRSEVFKK